MATLRIWLILFLAAGQAQAGAWARGKGNTFVALSYALSADRQSLGQPDFDPRGYLSLMVEHGIAARYTFGVDAGRAESGDYKFVSYFSRTFGPAEAETKFALHLGGGFTRHFMGEEPLVYLGASVGRGVETPWGSGWAALDTTLYYRTETEGLVAKADATFGVNATDRMKLFVQVQAGQYPGNDPYLRVVPSMAYRIGEGRHVELGVSVGVAGDRDVGLKLGTWLSF